MNRRWDLEQWIDQNAIQNYFSFYPSLPAKELNMDQAEVLVALFDLVKSGKLFYKCEFRCPDCNSTLFRGEQNQTPTDIECDICGENQSIEIESVVPIFSFSPEYVEYLKKKNQLN